MSETMPTPAAKGTSRAARAVRATMAILVAVAGLAVAAPSTPAGAAELKSWDWILGAKRLPANPPRVAYLGLDAVETPASYVAKAKRNGTTTWCYISVGSIEEWQPDLAQFEAIDARERAAGRPGIIGKDYDGWPGERWLNVARYKLYLPLLAKRMELCAGKGFDMIEFDNLDGYQQDTGFRASRGQQVAFAKALARVARKNGLVPMQKNVPELSRQLEPHYGALLFEDCALWDFCADARRYVAKGKPVFNAEYPEAWKEEGRKFDQRAACEMAEDAGVDLVVKRLSLDTWIRRCN